MLELRGKIAVVTGAGSGIGRELALACAREGMGVMLADIDEAGMRETGVAIAPLGVRVESLRCDVAKALEVEALAERALTEGAATTPLRLSSAHEYPRLRGAAALIAAPNFAAPRVA